VFATDNTVNSASFVTNPAIAANTTAVRIVPIVSKFLDKSPQ
jgi:hypothetical protein